MKRKNILIVSSWLPWPLNTGGNVGVFYLLEYVSRHMNVTFVTHYDRRRRNDRYLKDLGEKLPNVKFLLYNYRKSPLLRAEILWRVVIHLAKRIRIPGTKLTMLKLLPSLNITPGLSAFVNEVIQSEKIDIVQIEFVGMYKLVHALPEGVKKIFIHHQLDWVVHDLGYDKDMFSSFTKSFEKADEIATLNRFDTVVALTEVDKQKLLEAGVTTNIVVSTLAITNEFQPKSENVFDGRLTFVGGYAHTPNFRGIKWFVSEVLPVVNARFPQVSLHVVGSWSQEAIEEIKSIDSNVVFEGFVEDLGQVLHNSLVVVPINIGSGMRMKILEAANYSVPFVSTPVGAEGLIFESGKDCIIADGPEEMVRAIFAVIEDNALYQKFSENSHATLVREYSVEAMGKKRLTIYE